ncbi:MAG: hypothetical protein LUD03_03895 [Firmicutes bacterium]|nr:hypothetical protein [Bacillota bacterium]
MNKKFIAAASAAIMAVQGIAMPIIANAEASATYITDSCFTDCAIGGAANKGYYGLNILLDDSPWLSKGSASVHYETYMHDDELDIDYCNMYTNSDKTGSNDGAGSMYMYQRDTTSNFSQTYGYCQFDIRMHEGTMGLMLGSFSDPTSNTDYIANTITFTASQITAMDGASSITLANITTDKWYTVKIAVNNILQEMDISVTDTETGKVIGSVEKAAYYQSACTKVCIWCFSYVRGNTYNYDLTHVTIDKSTEKTNPYSVL